MTLYDNSHPDPLSITVTPRHAGYVYYEEGKEADQDGEPKTITVTDDTPFTLPHAIVGDYADDLKGVDANAPFYSEFDVKVTYEYSQFLADFTSGLAPNEAVSTDLDQIDMTYILKDYDSEDEVTVDDDANGIPQLQVVHHGRDQDTVLCGRHQDPLPADGCAPGCGGRARQAVKIAKTAPPSSQNSEDSSTKQSKKRLILYA